MTTIARHALLPLALVLLTVPTGGCTMHSTATHWNKRVGPDGQPVFVKSSTNVGMNLGIVLPVLGSTTVDRMIDTLTAEIAVEQGDHVRIVQSSAENYWYGFPPFTWIFTPVITTVVSEYRPSPEAQAKAEAEPKAAAGR